jgi:hypothetical protein
MQMTSIWSHCKKTENMNQHMETDEIALRVKENRSITIKAKLKP